MLLFLINVDDVPLQIPSASLAALFVDDLSGVWSSHDVNSLQNSIVSDFSSLYKWSIQNQQVFSSEKFQMLNLGRQLSNEERDKITFNGETLTWGTTAKFLGVNFDSHLSLRPEMEARLKRLKTSSWRVFQSSSPIDGLDAGTLNTILTFHIKSIIYSLWIPLVDFWSFSFYSLPDADCRMGIRGSVAIHEFDLSQDFACNSWFEKRL